MNPQIENSISRIAEQARGRFQKAIKTARSRTELAAERVTDGKKSVKTLSKLSLKLTAVTHRTADKVLKQQTKMLEHQIDAFAGNLSAAAEATNIRSLVKMPFRMIPENASLFVNDARSALGIVVGAGTEVRELLKGTVMELRGSRKVIAKKPASKKSTVKKPAKPRKKTAKKKADAPVAAKVEASLVEEQPKAA
jgi:hypothetical protein